MKSFNATCRQSSKSASIIFSLLLLATLHLNAMSRKVLFIGNSYTYTNNMPAMLDSMAAALGDTLTWDMAATGGFTLSQHCTDPATIAKINSQHWDIVVLQEQSELPAFPPTQVDTQVYPYAARLDSMIHANDTCTQTMFLMTWGHANGDPLNCAFYPTICTYNGMQERLRESYLQMGIDNHALVAPVGSAFKIFMDSMYTPWLYMSDSDHPVVPGSYLEAAVLYSSIFHKSTIGCSYTASGISASALYSLQRVATKVVFDSFAQWQQNGHYPYAGFQETTHSDTVTWTSLCPVATSYSWSFGDGATSTASNPTHIYSATGTYTVTNTVHTNCFSETATDTVSVIVHHTGVVTTAPAGEHIAIVQAGSGNIVFALPADGTEELDIFNCNGITVRQFKDPASRIEEHLAPGFYCYKRRARNGQILENGKFVVY